MKLTEQYLKRLIRQMIKENEEYDLEGEQQEMTSKMQGNEAKLKHKNVKMGLEELHRLLQSGRPDIHIQEMATIVERLLRGIEVGSLPLK